MVSRATAALVVMIALFVAAIRLPAASCVLTNTRSDKACKPGCCANKTCCATSHKRTGLPAQPAVKASFDQPVTLALAAGGWVLPLRFVSDSDFVSEIEHTTHAPPPLALICIRLI